MQVWSIITEDFIYFVSAQNKHDARRAARKCCENFQEPIRSERYAAIQVARVEPASRGFRLIRTFPLSDLDSF